tara:strand:- start:1517 stop:3007 length:1491 start_codon:yes stop_codon:yes gene_type:complete
MRLDEIEQPITNAQLNALEKALDNLFSSLNIDVEFTRHFIDRANDDRNGQQITMPELVNLFKKEYKRWGKPIAQLGPDAEAVMKDLESNINIPFALRWDRDNEELDLIAKTVMRKKNFKTSNKEFPVESIEESPSVISSQQMLAKLSKEMQGTHTGTSNPNSDWSKFVLSHKGFTLKDVQVDQIPTAVNSDGMSQANIEKYKQADLSKFPPMVIGNDGYILDGNHRLQAYKAQGIKKVKAYVGEESTVDVSEDFGSVPPLAELIIMAVLAKTTVDVLKGMFKVAITTGKGIKKLRSLQQKTKRLGQNIADYALPEDFSHPDKAILNVPERYMKAALDALHRLVTSKGNRQSVSGYAFDISRTMHGINARELADVYNKIHESNEDDFYLIVEYNKGQPVKQSDPLRVLDNLAARKDNMPFPIKFKDNEEIKVTPELAKRFTMAYHDIARPEQKEIIKQYLRTKEGFKKIVNKMQLNKNNFGKNANANLASLDRNIKN